MKGMHWANRTLAVAVGASLLAAPAAEATPNAVPAYGDVRFLALAAQLPAGSHDEDPDNGFPPTIHFTDFASAGNPWSPENRYQVWLPELIPGR